MAFDLAALPLAAKLLVALLADLLGSFTGRFQPVAHVEFIGVLRHELAHGSRHGQANVGVNVDLAYAELDRLLNLFNWHAIGFAHVAAVFVDGGQQILRHRAGAVHHQVRVGNALVDLLDALNRQDVASGLARELVSAVAGADGDGQRIQLGALHKICGLLGVGQQLLHGHRRLGAVAIFLVALHGLQ